MREKVGANSNSPRAAKASQVANASLAWRRDRGLPARRRLNGGATRMRSPRRTDGDRRWRATLPEGLSGSCASSFQAPWEILLSYRSPRPGAVFCRARRRGALVAPVPGMASVLPRLEPSWSQHLPGPRKDRFLAVQSSHRMNDIFYYMKRIFIHACFRSSFSARARQSQRSSWRASPHRGALTFPHAMFWLRLAQSGESPWRPLFRHPCFSHQESVRYGQPIKPAGEKTKRLVNFLQRQGQPASQAPSLLPSLPR